MSKEYFLRAGTLRHRIQIQRRVVTRDAIGGEIVTFNTIATRSGSIRPITGREMVSADQVDPIISHEIRMRFFDGLLATDRLSFREKIYNITAVRDIDERMKLQSIFAIQDVTVIIQCVGNEDDTCILLESGAELLLDVA